MRRLAAFAATLACALAALALSAAGGDDGSARVDAVFDNAAGLIPGQDVKIAGARVGEVRAIRLTPERRARVEMELDPGFAPFRSDARCTIRPQSLIGEKFVQCDPGSPDGRPLPSPEGGAPTVPIERTSSPVDLDLVFAALRRPVRERLAIVVGELGAGLAGRPRELSAAIRRANPALREANEVLAILDRDRATLGRLVDETDAALARLRGAERRVGSFVERADAVARTVAERRDALGESVRRLPPLLREAEPAARDLAVLSGDALPLVRDLRDAAPALARLAGDIGPLADAARPALVELGQMARVGRRALNATRPVAERLDPIAGELVPLVRVGRPTLESLRDTGGVESVLRFLFYAGLSNSRFDRVSHIAPSYQIFGSCNMYATAPVAGCSAHFGRVEGAGAAGAGRERPGRADARERRGPGAGRPPARRRAREPRGGGERRPERPARPPRAPAPAPEAPADLPALPLLDWLLGP